MLVSTHYMDEAERCNRIVYLASGRIVVQGDAPDGGAAFRPGHLRGDRRADRRGRAARCAACRASRAAAVFGRALHVAGIDRAALERSDRARATALAWREVEPRLEDVFIHC